MYARSVCRQSTDGPSVECPSTGRDELAPLLAFAKLSHRASRYTMLPPFSKTLAFLDIDERGIDFRVLVIVAALLSAWIAWLVFARVAVYAVSEEGRLLAGGAAAPVQSQVEGVVSESELQLGMQVSAGDVLIRLNAQAQLLQRTEEATHLEGLLRTAESLSSIMAAERELALATTKSSASRVSSAGARARAAAGIEEYAQAQNDAMRHLNEASLASGLDALKAAADLHRERGLVAVASADAADALADLSRTRQETAVRLLTLDKEQTDLRARIAASRAMIAALDWEISRHTVRAPIAGKVADLLPLSKGAIVSPGQVLATVVPQAGLRWVAYFPPGEAVGRIHEGQLARIRLDAFPWTAYGVLEARVVGVGSEPRAQRVRVELAPEGRNPEIPLLHGLTGVVEVTVERISALRLLLRLSGQYVQGSSVAGKSNPQPAILPPS
jgi:multidrug resistance efflux pump